MHAAVPNFKLLCLVAKSEERLTWRFGFKKHFPNLIPKGYRNLRFESAPLRRSLTQIETREQNLVMCLAVVSAKSVVATRKMTSRLRVPRLIPLSGSV
jgi:hypothetical protein